MSKINVHIINHTHWDREWFLSAVYTTHWIPTLIDKLLELSAANPEFRYLFDGQTLVAEDLFEAYPDYLPKVEKLIAAGNLTIGPYYCQPDWKLTGGESLMRNLEYGLADTARLGGTSDVGWLVDTFGHISQAPQIHQAFGIESVFVWRGVPQLVPYFDWHGADGTTLFGVDLFGGYRNLYGVTHAPEVALRRLDTEVQKLAPYYPTADLPLFDGYDLEDNPEDPVRFYETNFNGQVSKDLTLLESTPAQFVATVQPKLNALPQITGELNSGKYGATFPGTYSARVYAKVMGHDCANIVYNIAEPLAVMAHAAGRQFPTARYEAWSRKLLQNDVHDVVCGVSIDQVHEKAEAIYADVFNAAQADIEESLRVIFQDFAAGPYAVSTIPTPYSGLQLIDDALYIVETNGIGIWPVKRTPLVATHQSIDTPFTFENAHYRLQAATDTGLVLNDSQRIYFELYAEDGDTYSDETGALIAQLVPTVTDIQLLQGGAVQLLKLSATHQTTAHNIAAIVTLRMDETAQLGVEIELDSTGTEFRLELVIETAANGNVYAAMPFDIVERPFVDTDLLPRNVDDASAKIFMGQRELNEIRSYPFHGLVGIAKDEQATTVLAKGIYAYRAYEAGRLAITLRRSVHWLTRPNLENRVGDAGPFFYVPDARGERTVKHEFAVIVGDIHPTSAAMLEQKAAFQTPPFVVEWQGAGAKTTQTALRGAAALSSIRIVGDMQTARWYNPTTEPITVNNTTIDSKKVVTLSSPAAIGSAAEAAAQGNLSILNGPEWRVGENKGTPDAQLIAELDEKAAISLTAKQQAEAQLATATGSAKHIAQHQVYVHHREHLEYLLSAHLNRLKAALEDGVTDAYLYDADPLVVKIGWELNQLRIKRRIYDYVVAAL